MRLLEAKMCGIYFSLSKRYHLKAEEEIVKRLQARGPDSSANANSHSTDFDPTGHPRFDTLYTVLYSTVLGLRGSHTVEQPRQDLHARYTLCWNGEAWSIDGLKNPCGNDTAEVYHMLSMALGSEEPRDDEDPFERIRTIACALSRIAGPYAFILRDFRRRRTFFGRDFLGRRSLLMRVTDEGDLILSSVSDGKEADGWTEVEPDGVYCARDIAENEIDPPAGIQVRRCGSFDVELVPYNFAEYPHTDDSPTQSVIPRLTLNKDVSTVHQPLSEDSPAVTKLETLLRASLSLRVLHIPKPPTNNTNQQDTAQPKLAILFSGGLDCTVLARISHDLLPISEPIDLLNVAFENPRIHKSNTNGDGNPISPYESCPDRVTGRASYAELCRLCPGREWRFGTIDIPYTETQQHREQVISLMHPHNTEMDLSICNALYFAARGEGHIQKSPGKGSVPYKTPARVLLSGLGADELFAGYTRHATAFKRSGLDGLLQELELDVARLGKRNLGRDDRVMSHWGKEVRFPYLDENLLSWALAAHVTEKCGFGEPDRANSFPDDVYELEPGKKVLRCLALKLGMTGVAKEKKRAIQFGARTAKMETGKTKGTHLLT